MSSKKEWLSQISKENPGKDLDQFNHTIDGQIKDLAFAHQEDIEGLDIGFSAKQESNEWNIGIQFQIEQQDTSSEPIYYALEHGAEHLEFFFKNSSQIINYLDVIDQIHLNMIHTSWNFEQLDIQTWDELIQKFESRNATLDHVYFPINRNQNHFHQVMMQRKDNSMFQSFNRAYTFPLFNILEWKLVLKNLSDDLNLYPLEGNEMVSIDLILGNDFLTTIASIRALNKCLQSKFTNISFRIQTRLDERLWNQDHHTHLMISSLSSLASSIAGVSTIWCSGARFYTMNADLSKIRNLLHVQHILKNESFLNRVIDPGAGSYYFEDLTEKIFLKLYELY